MNRSNDLSVHNTLYKIFIHSIEMLIGRGCDRDHLEKHYIKPNSDLSHFIKNYKKNKILIIDKDFEYITYIDNNNLTTNKKDIENILKFIEQKVSDQIDESNKKVSIIIVINKVISSEKISESDIKKQKQYADRYRIENKKIAKIIQDYDLKYIQKTEIFFFDDLIINPNKHMLVGTYYKLTEDEKKELLDSGLFKLHQISEIDVDEPLIRWFGGEVGDIFKCTTYNESISGGLTTSRYRRVVINPL